MQLRLLAFVLLCAFTAQEALPAQKLPFDPSLAAASAIAPATIMQEDLTPRVLSVRPTAGYFTYGPEVDDLGSTANGNGFGASIEATYSQSEHFGLGLTALGYSGSGSYTAGNTGTSNITTGTNGSSKVSGTIIGAMAVFDPFEGKGFRLPIFAGLNYESLSSSMPSAAITGTTLKSPGLTAGFSPRFSIGVFRIEPFLVLTVPFETAQLSCQGNANCAQIPASTLPVYGVNFVFTPLKIAFFFSITNLAVDTGASYYSLGHSFAF